MAGRPRPGPSRPLGLLSRRFHGSILGPSPEAPLRNLSAALLLCAVSTAWAGRPLKVAVESATYLSGPGREPPPGSPPFEPRIRSQVRLQGLTPGAVPEFRIWRMPETSARALRRGRAVRKGIPGLLRVEGFTAPLTPGTYRIQAPVGTAWRPGECLVVEVFLQGRWAGRGSAPLLAVDLMRRERPGDPEPTP